MRKLGTLFTGGGGFDIGAREAGIELAWGVEYQEDIAEHANSQLGDHIICADILDLRPADLEPVDWLHASPPCPSFSVANSNKGETKLDTALGEKVAQFIKVLRPKYFSLENVYGYRHSQSWAAIAGVLHKYGYGFIVEHINSADFGVPQRRRRMIVRAVRDTFWSPAPMVPTHSKDGSPAWVGWWEAVKDIADTFPPSQLAPWQVKRLSGTGDQLLIPGGNANSFSTPAGDEPSRAVGDTNRVGNIPRAILVDATYSNSDGDGIAYVEEPTNLVNANQQKWRAILFARKISTKDGKQPNYIDEAEPSHAPSPGRIDGERVIHPSGRVVALTPRALARFQTFPDWYELPEKKTLAVTIIGNAVPCLLAQRIVESLL